MKKLNYFAVIILAIFIFACSSEEDQSSPPAVEGDSPVESSFSGQNNIATLEGGEIGSGIVANEYLYKTISVVLKNPSSHFSLGPAKIIDDGLSVKLILPVKNNTENLAFCNIVPEGMALYDFADQWIVTTISDNKVIGSLGIADSTDASSCLAADKTGYILQSITAVDESFISLYDDVEQLEIDEITYGSSSVIDPNISVIPQSYSIKDGAVTVDIKNTNQDYGYVWPGRSYVILLDYDDEVPEDSTTDTPGDPIYSPGTPFYYFVIDSSFSMPYQLKPGEEAEMESDEIDFEGSSKKAIVILGLGADAFSSAYNVVNKKP